LYDSDLHSTLFYQFTNSILRVHGIKSGSNCEFSVKGFSSYVGEISNGEITGKGIKKWEDGRFYEGEWVLGEMSGYGKWISANKYEVYEGYFADNRRNGRGLLTFGNGDFFVGNFVNHKFEGGGKYDIKSKGYEIEGSFMAGDLSGLGRIIWNEKCYLYGSWNKGVAYNLCTYILNDGTLKYVGLFENGFPTDLSEYVKVDLEKVFLPTVSDTANDKKDGKKDNKKESKEVKKKAVPAKKAAKEIPVSVTLYPSQNLGKVVITLVNRSQRTNKSTKLPKPSQRTDKINSIRSSLIQVSLTSPYELRRRLLVRLRQLSGDGHEDVPTGSGPLTVGAPVPFWMQCPSLHDSVTEWSRFPAGSLRFLDGRDSVHGLMLFKGRYDFSSSANAPRDIYDGKAGDKTPSLGEKSSLSAPVSRQDSGAHKEGPDLHTFFLNHLSLGDHAFYTVTPGDLKGAGKEFTSVLDFRLDAVAIADALTDITR